jgi:hypothetical protein
VADWETWPAQLQRISGRSVINGGVGGYGIDQAFLRARRLLSRYRFSTVIFSFIPDDIRRCQMSVMAGAAKPYFDFKDGRLTPENVPVPPPARLSSKGRGPLPFLEHSRLMHSVMVRLFPDWWLAGAVRVQNEERGRDVSCALLHELEKLTRGGSELIILVEYERKDIFSASISMAVGQVLSCLTDPATRVLDLKAPSSELNAKDPWSYNRFYIPHNRHMSAEGNQFVALEISRFLRHKSTEVYQNKLSPAP